MCGISGFVPGNPERADNVREVVERMSERMRLRGPDHDGLWSERGVALGHRRLSILDLDPRSNQPMVSQCGEYVIVFNGEIYNYRELRQELQADGIVFRTTSDTEVLLILYSREGERMLCKLRGMFAFGIWNTRSRELFLARDPYGIKPLYYAATATALIFASQVKSIIASGLISPEHEPAGLAGFYLWGSVPEPWTLFRGIVALAPGHWLRWNSAGASQLVNWHDIRQGWRRSPERVSPVYLQELVQQAVNCSVKAHLVADVPLCLFLSGGVDSGAIAGVLADLGVPVEGITISFEAFLGRRLDESATASFIAGSYGLRHHVRLISRAEFERDLPRILHDMDQPSVDGINTWFACKAAAERNYKVVLSGVGGDELFCGYGSFSQVPQMYALGRVLAAIPGMRRLLREPCKLLARSRSQNKFSGIPDFMDSLEGAYFLHRSLFLPKELPGLMGETMAREGLGRLGGALPGMPRANARDAVAAVGLLESTQYLRNQLLRDSDWASMAHSLELRTPLVDSVLLEALGPHTSGFVRGAGKRMLAAAPKLPLPAAVQKSRKIGFGVPMEEWWGSLALQRSKEGLPAAHNAGEAWPRRWARMLIAGTKAGN
jgi:asparagine synthase (glutamine-hydrolysing)